MVCCLRTILVLVSWGVAIGIPHFELCLALVGSFATSILAFILPPFFHLCLFWREGVRWRKVFHIVLLSVGVVITLLATVINLYMAIAQYSPSITCEKLQMQCRRQFLTSYDHCAKS